MVKKKCTNNEIEKKLTENRLIECDNKNQNEISKNEIEIPKKRKYKNDNKFELKRKMRNTDNTFFHSSDDIFFLCSEKFDDTHRYGVRYINKEYEKDILHLNDITSSAYNLFNNF